MEFTGHLKSDLAGLGLSDWHDVLQPLIAERLSPAAHGDLPAWQQSIAALPEVVPSPPSLTSDVVRLLENDLSEDQQQSVRQALLQLAPWRKGPFDVGGVVIDAEWRSDMKWRRVQQAVALQGKRILDVGCGNGYYALRMLGAGADCVIGVDPTLLYVMQFRALQKFLPQLPIHILPLRSHELPQTNAAFDVVFSMGVLYHQRSPLEHLRELRRQLVPGGELLLETLILPGDEALARTPQDRYARMRNVWLLPSVAELSVWLERSGFVDIRSADITATSVEEQRQTAWMPFDSLREALDPQDSARTIEGWPAPLRAILTARKPG
ncbi:MAG: tRNA 5-methoxyuridine(34)/uridine 5-oxyacetic acid(34) synthase CmoB [Woeseia sp.]|nr:tRNA 5-methoxyuridine(34)/uridine 5-oxyacetic acid(34) synthase CmoB [Woeseia sp.]MBT8098040.1 tRNA 5-methoxyuridine(34)/uridine 5-oxyacetic acid(34) synthase CmoB [Woeseia sp.]NNE59933.1 tRNA 5-methoxyuridine(34)/uridine 5-oxyacetic acid(34) synthase CmoB [Woeseia sp.]NNL55122.1 tRNA 5-methoxyuridine(34)/uridine 5-oxyacetic acid(34) synthase CmoB [Woeseia sp.]